MAIGLTGVAFAQDVPPPAEEQQVPPPVAQQADQAGEPGDDPAVLLESEQEIESGEAATTESEIVVTGSRIRRPNLESVVPVTSIGGEEFFQQAQTNIGDTLNELPQLRSTFAQSNPGLGIGIAGLNLLDLRGLGTLRTLVLVNGRRHVGADILNNAVSPDVNTIPNDLIERVDIVTGGNSAIYGSDAIAGVVNFILRRNFEGVQVRGNAGISEEGFGNNYYTSVMFGRNFADGRANVTLHGEYANQDRVFASDVPFLRRNNGFLVVDTDPGGTPNGSDSIPDRVFVRDIRSATIHRHGLVPIVQPIGGANICGVSALNNLPYNCNFVFQPDGTLIPQTGTRTGTGIFGGFLGGNGQTGREERLTSVLPFMERYNANLLAHFTVNEWLEPFVEAKFVRVNTQGSNAGPSFIQGVMNQFDFRERVRLDNPFLTPEQRTQLTNAILASGCRPTLNLACNPATGSNVLTATDRTNIANGSFRFVVARHLADSGIRDEKFQRDTYRLVGGLRGTFNDDWSYELSANYGRFEEDTTTFGYVDRQRFMLAMDAGVNPATGEIQCRAQFDPAAAVAFRNDPDFAERLASDIAACVPYNPFGAGDNRAAADYFTYNARHSAKMEQIDFLGFVSGDTSQLFELPGGPIRFALGAEYRKEKAFYEQDPFVEGGFTNAVVIPTFEPPSFEVKEAFGEIQIPILRDLPVAYELTLSGAARVADYKGATGTVWAYNAGGEYAPIRDLRFRANYGRAVRAPNLSETGFPLVPNFAPGFQDPCLPQNIGSGSQFRAANCAADLGALLNDPGFRASPGNYSLAIVSGSNPNLEEEVSDSLTIGAVVQPRFIPGLSLSADYYDIEVKNVIVTLGAQTIVNQCYDLPDLNNQFCALFTRFRGPGLGPLNEIPGQPLGNSLIAAGVNFASRVRRGIDFEGAYRTNLGPDMRLDTRLIWTHSFEVSNFQDPTDPEFEDRVLGELGDPEDEFRWDVALTRGIVTLGYQLSYIGPMWVNAFEDFNELQGRPPQDADWADIRKYPSVYYHDLRLDFNLRNPGGGLGREFQFFVGVDNITDKDPPFGLTGLGAGSAIYNIRGRQFYGGFRARF